jgi:hypothetical protein
MKSRERICLKIGCILILCFISASVSGEELTLFKGYYLSVNAFTGTQNAALEMRFDTDENMYYLFYRIAVTGTPVWIGLTENDLAIFRNNMKKFIEWEAIARKENANISRELPESAIDAVNVIQGSRSERAESRNLSNLLFRFDTNTQATRMAGVPLLLIASNQVVSRNAYNMVTIQVMINLTSAQAQALLTEIEPDNVKRNIDKAKSQSNLFH